MSDPAFEPSPSSTESPSWRPPQPIEVVVVHPVRDRYWLHALLLLATVLTTLITGAALQFNFQHSLYAYSTADIATPSFFPIGWILHHPGRLLLGLPFSLTLLLILLCHEMGHYLYCRRYRVWASLPYFIPFPSLAGTLGAFIRIRSSIRSRAALFDIGIAGPIAGFLPALAALFLGLWLSAPASDLTATREIEFGYPFIFRAAQHILAAFTNTGVHRLPLDRLYLHPIAFAAWVGMVVTSLNLLPGGQLDGGHILYAVFPRAHRWITLITAGMLIPMGLQSVGWWIWAAVLLATGREHPEIPAWPGLNTKRKALALAMTLVLLVTITPVPILYFSAADVFPGIFARHGTRN